MSVEGMWAIYFGDVATPTTNSGIIILETERLFGGDSMIAYLGSYGIDGNILSATANTWSYYPTQTVQTAFGGDGSPTLIQFQGERIEQPEGPVIVGKVWEQRNPALTIPAAMRRIADLP